MDKNINQSVFLLDMDGTIYLGNELIEGAKEFLSQIKSREKKYLFLTNNASKNKKIYIDKLKNMGIFAEDDDIYTSGDATINYLKKLGKKTVFLVGNSSLKKEFLDGGLEVIEDRGKDIDAVVVSFDTELNYEKLWIACEYLAASVDYFATHPDYVCPLEGGKFMPDSGAIIEFLYAATSRRPIVIGKPEKTMVEGIIEKFNYNIDDLIMVGDRLYTDIEMGKKANIKTALVLSGETSIKDYENSNTRADFVFDSVKEIIPYI